jgi:hypothetical protein
MQYLPSTLKCTPFSHHPIEIELPSSSFDIFAAGGVVAIWSYWRMREGEEILRELEGGWGGENIGVVKVDD